MAIETYYAIDVKAGMTHLLSGVEHPILDVTSRELCSGGNEIVLTYGECACHTGPSNCLGFSPIDLITVVAA